MDFPRQQISLSPEDLLSPPVGTIQPRTERQRHHLVNFDMNLVVIIMDAGMENKRKEKDFE